MVFWNNTEVCYEHDESIDKLYTVLHFPVEKSVHWMSATLLWG